MSGVNQISSSLTLKEAHEALVAESQNQELQKKFSQAVIDNFLGHKKNNIEKLSDVEKVKMKGMLENYMSRWVKEKIEKGEDIDVQQMHDPVELGVWLEAYKTIIEKNADNTTDNNTDNTTDNNTDPQHGYGIDTQQAKINELTQKLNEAQMGTMINPVMRKLNLGLIDIKYPGKGDRTTRHFRELQPMYLQYMRVKKQNPHLPKEQKIQMLRDMIEFAGSVFPDASSVLYQFQKGNFQTILNFSKKRREKLATLIKQDESAGKLSPYKHNRLMARKGLFNLFNEVLAELEQLLIKDEWKKQSFSLAA